MIVTSAEIKTLLQIIVSTWDTLIATLIPIIQDEIVQYCNTHFEKTILNTDNEEYDGGDTISFTASTKTISDSDGDLPFSAGQNVYISGSRYNDGHYTIATAGTGSFTVSETLIDEAVGANVTIQLVIWPSALKMIVAHMVNHIINGKDAGTTSESISGAMSVGFGIEIGSFPQSLLNGLNKFRVVRFR